MSYYQTNAVYEGLKSIEHDFLWVSGNAWTLIYGDSNATPKAVVLVAGLSWQENSSVVNLMKKISSVSGLPFFFVYFDDSSNEIEAAKVMFNQDDLGEIPLSELKNLFSGIGLPVKDGQARKYVNDATSSAYHNWQRDSLGAIVVSDIDLFRKGGGGFPAEIIELKRSYYSLEKWRPFRDDYANFNLLLNLSKMCGITLKIAYNVRHKNPFYDDVSSLTVFDYSRQGSPNLLGAYDFMSFVNGDYRG